MRHSHRLPHEALSPSAHRALVRQRLAQGKWRPFGIFLQPTSPSV
jgi:hypothetical protein